MVAVSEDGFKSPSTTLPLQIDHHHVFRRLNLRKPLGLMTQPNQIHGRSLTLPQVNVTNSDVRDLVRLPLRGVAFEGALLANTDLAALVASSPMATLLRQF